MSDDDEQQPPGTRPFMKFRMPCPNCMGGTRHRARMGVSEDGSVGTAHIPEKCRDCDGAGFLPLRNGEWKRKRSE
ncbi:hypothetical protein ACWC5I_48515 [Kitasatospora sp. NPDC001574]